MHKEAWAQEASNLESSTSKHRSKTNKIGNDGKEQLHNTLFAKCLCGGDKEQGNSTALHAVQKRKEKREDMEA